MEKIDLRRVKHSITVGEVMAEIATKLGDDSVITPKHAYELGLLHDIGYLYCKNLDEHAHIGGLVLKESGYAYWQEVYYHGVVQSEYSSQVLDMLNSADLSVSPDGRRIGYFERLTDIMDRYGEKSVQYINACKLVESLQQSEA